MAERIVISSDAQKHIQAYIEYRNIVGDADGGKMLSEEEYEEFKKRAMIARENRIYVSWRNVNTGMDCKQIGPQSLCFCTHRYRDHATDNYADKNIHCRVPRCKCSLFDHIPVRGTQDVKCHCKHSYDVHQVGFKGRPCKTCSCKSFASSLSCSCNEPYSAHQTVFETRDERVAQGKPVDNLGGGGEGYAALGGITNFSSLIDGVDRLEQPSITAPSAQSAAPKNRQQKMDDEMAIYAARYDKKKSAHASGSGVSRLAGGRNRPTAATTTITTTSSQPRQTGDIASQLDSDLNAFAAASSSSSASSSSAASPSRLSNNGRSDRKTAGRLTSPATTQTSSSSPSSSSSTSPSSSFPSVGSSGQTRSRTESLRQQPQQRPSPANFAPNSYASLHAAATSASSSSPSPDSKPTQPQRTSNNVSPARSNVTAIGRHSSMNSTGFSESQTNASSSPANPRIRAASMNSVAQGTTTTTSAVSSNRLARNRPAASMR